MNALDPLKTAKSVSFATAGGLILVMQFILFGAVLDFVSDLLLIGIAFMAGRMSK